MPNLVRFSLVTAILFFLFSCDEPSSSNTLQLESQKKRTDNPIGKLLDSLRANPKSHEQTQQEILSEIEKINEVHEMHTGWGGMVSAQFKNFLTLEKEFDTNELVKLTDDTNAVIACYAGWALINKGYSKIPEIFLKFQSKNAQVMTFHGCTKMPNLLSDEFYHHYLFRLQEKKENDDKLLFHLDSIILYSDKSSWLILYSVLGNRTYPESFNKRIEYLAFKLGNMDAVDYLIRNFNNRYCDQVSVALLNHLNKTDFRNIGPGAYYESVSKVLQLRKPNFTQQVIKKLRKDRCWETDREIFRTLLREYNLNLEKDVLF